jgi:hypothetical protein
MARAPKSPTYHYEQKLGDPNAAYTRAADARPDLGRPEIPANFVVAIEGETLINSLWGKRSVPWRTEAGTPCVILGYWADGTLRLSWPAIRGAYRVDGRFPAWVVAEDLDARMAGGGHILAANDPPPRPAAVLNRFGALVAHLLHLGS